MEHMTNEENKRTRNNMSDTDTSGDEDQFMDDEVHEVIKRKKKKINLIYIRAFVLDTNSNSSSNSIRN
jgi:hypothetical protein